MKTTMKVFIITMVVIMTALLITNVVWAKEAYEEVLMLYDNDFYHKYPESNRMINYYRNCLEESTGPFLPSKILNVDGSYMKTYDNLWERYEWYMWEYYKVMFYDMLIA